MTEVIIWVYDDICIQHAKGASWEEERNDNRNEKMKHEIERTLGDGNENMKVTFAFPCQDGCIRAK